MSAQLAGKDYLQSYSGLLKIIEQALNIAVAVLLVIIDRQNTKTYFLFSVSIYAFLSCTLFLILSLKTTLRKSTFPWYWIECINYLILVISYTLASSVVISILTKGFIIIGIFGYIAAMVYFLDTIDKYKLAWAPRTRYVWTTPNMPE